MSDGWDSAVIDQAARTAAIHCRPTFLDPVERYEVAWSAIAFEHVLNSSATLRELGSVGMDAINDETKRYRRERGLSDNARAYNTYWLDRSWSQNDVASLVTNPIALRQVLDSLDAIYRNDLMIFAVVGSPARFAEMMGISTGTAHARIRSARVAFYKKWYDHEQPPRPAFDRRLEQPLPDRCPSGHEFTPENTGWRKATSGLGRRKRRCKACAAEYKQRIRSAA